MKPLNAYAAERPSSPVWQLLLAWVGLHIVSWLAATALFNWPRFFAGFRASLIGRAAYALARAWLEALGFGFQYPLAGVLFFAGGFVLFLLAVRKWGLWMGALWTRLMPTGLEHDEHGFPFKGYRAIDEIKRRPKGLLFVGMTRTKRRWLPGFAWEPLYLDDRQRSAHRHVLGKTGSGKTTSVLWPQVLQDMLDGRGVVVMDAKGSDENIATLKALARVAGRKDELKVFSLPAWNRPQLFTHAYNLAWVRPRTPTDPGGEPVAVAERLLSVLPLGDNTYYRTQAQLCLTSLLTLLHGMVDDTGHGIPFNLEDVMVCLRGVGQGTGDGFGRALEFCLNKSTERESAVALKSQFARLAAHATEVLSGLSGAVERFQSPIVNAYAPDIVFEDVLEKNQLVYLQLPTNLMKLQAPALGRALLMDLQQAGSLRQVFRKERNQRPCSVVVDEFAAFADEGIIDSLNKLRDANLHFTLAHQSLADLETVSKEFAQAVWDNTLTKDVLAQDNPELCERIAKSLGTYQREERTVQMFRGPLLTETLGGSSVRLVEAYRLHPNAIKSLAPVGQGFVLGAAYPRQEGAARLGGDAGLLPAPPRGPPGELRAPAREPEPGPGAAAVRAVCRSAKVSHRHRAQRGGVAQRLARRQFN